MAALTRKELVLQLLRSRIDEWVDGPEIANERVGGSEGLRRLRELRDDGHVIEERRHPNPRRDIWQYRLRNGPAVKRTWKNDDLRMEGPYGVPQRFLTEREMEQIDRPVKIPSSFPLAKNEDGSIAYIGEPTVDDLAPMPAQPPIEKYEAVPAKIDFGTTMLCPRCKGVKTKTKGKFREFSSEPNHPAKPCIRCDGLGIVPNKGPNP